VGADNFFLFGLTAEEVLAKKAAGYNPWDYFNSNDELRLAFDRLSSGFFSHGDPNLFKPLLDSLLYRDDYLLLADYQSYVECQDRVGKAYRDQDHWTRMSIFNVARMGKFSSDRSIQDYLQNIWKAPSVQVEVPEYSQSNGDLKLSL
jgi:starch phosphorylase